MRAVINMVGEDAVSVYTQLLMKFMDLLVKIGEEKQRNKQPKKPKTLKPSSQKKRRNTTNSSPTPTRLRLRAISTMS